MHDERAEMMAILFEVMLPALSMGLLSLPRLPDASISVGGSRAEIAVEKKRKDG